MYKTPDIKNITQLQLLRHGWFNPSYELTDQADSFGKLSYKFFPRRVGNVVTATGAWTFEFEGAFSRTILIKDGAGTIIGKSTRDFFSRKRLLTMETGFQAEFYHPNFLLDWEYIWKSAGYGKIMRIKNCPWKFKSTVYVEQSMAPIALMPLLIFLGAHLIVLGRRKNAARH